jgi:hypothetical protein
MDITELQRNRINVRHPWEEVRARIIKALIQKHHSCFHILDAGSGDAFVLNYLCSFNLASHYTAVDIAYTNEIIKIINQRISCNINFLQAIPEKLSPKADTILLLDVLEHCKDDSALLEELNSNDLIQSPLFFITVPAYPKLFSQHDKLLLHYRRYTTKTLKELCKKNNLKVISSGYFFTSLLVIRCIQLFLEKLGLRKPEKSIDNWTGGYAISKIISSILWIDFLTGRFFSHIGIQIPGLSAYCICRPLPS